LYYSLLVITCLSAPICSFSSADSYGLLLRSETECRMAAERIARSTASHASSYAYRYRCDRPQQEGDWVQVSYGETSNGLRLSGE
jgi:hypothetical protein